LWCDAGIGFGQKMHRMLQLAMLNRSCSDDKTAIPNGLTHGVKFFRSGENIGGRSYGRARFPKCQVERFDYAEMKRAKVAHGAGYRTQIEGVAGLD
jgi:hypothetical protein